MLRAIYHAHRLLLSDNDMVSCPIQPPDRGILDSLEPIQQAVAECSIKVGLQAVHICLNDQLGFLETAKNVGFKNRGCPKTY